MNILTTERIVVSGEDITLSKLIWRRFRQPIPGLAELTLDRNPALSGLGVVLPVGTSFDLPIPITADEPETLEVVRLW